MRFPYPKYLDVSPISISITNGLNEGGAPKEVATFIGKCNFSENAKRTFGPDGKLLQLQAKVLIGCDIAPSVKLLEGSVTVNERSFNICRAKRLRNPDGSIHHTELELI